MFNAKYTRRYLAVLSGALAVCAYPLYMGASVIVRTLRDGAVPAEAYPKYVIPYAPVALALLLCTALMPVFHKFAKKAAFPCAAAFGAAVFFVSERVMETRVLVQTQELIPLESWQMSLCYVPPEMYETRTWAAVDVLLGGYSPAFKLHFYLISLVIVVSLLNAIFGFGGMQISGDTRRKRALVLQTVTAAAFLGMCVWACFTAFYRTGELTVSALSAALMAVFFVLLGVTVGVFAGSFTLSKRKGLAVGLPAFIAAAATLLMYAGELILLSGSLYRFGSGFFFEGLGKLALAPADILVILAAAAVTAVLCSALQPRKRTAGV